MVSVILGSFYCMFKWFYSVLISYLMCKTSVLVGPNLVQKNDVNAEVPQICIPLTDQHGVTPLVAKRGLFA